MYPDVKIRKQHTLHGCRYSDRSVLENFHAAELIRRGSDANCTKNGDLNRHNLTQDKEWQRYSFRTPKNLNIRGIMEGRQDKNDRLLSGQVKAEGIGQKSWNLSNLSPTVIFGRVRFVWVLPCTIAVTTNRIALAGWRRIWFVDDSYSLPTCASQQLGDSCWLEPVV